MPCLLGHSCILFVFVSMFITHSKASYSSNWWNDVQRFLVSSVSRGLATPALSCFTSVLVVSHPCGELWHRKRADGFGNVRFTHTRTEG